ncbi:MAG: hypothetical protein E6I42_00230 [Chloroflexi bacterium]|nr:MAG: hypothetical protein E6J30_06400 [Chloroflexota bacterium]TMD80802.1 MAG: hypothetical protein E6I77_00820 [Chloroflexota bacterium]TMF07330.1 MAG: hypothetical protein E6I42_00230 [Chloroflexota bacterium]TMG27198.1 MAG: hypothetical protein E6H97_07075 [Chloroflexota bacterium]
MSSPSDDDVRRMVRGGVQAWQPRRGPDFSDLLLRIGAGPSPWVLYTAASAALVVILLAAFLVGSYYQIGALAPQSIPANIH